MHTTHYIFLWVNKHNDMNHCLTPLDFALDPDYGKQQTFVEVYEPEVRLTLKSPWVVFSSSEKAMEYGENVLGCDGYVKVHQQGCPLVFRPCADTAGLEAVLKYESQKQRLCNFYGEDQFTFC